MKKPVSIFLMIVLVISLIGCNSNTTNNDTTQTNSVKTEELSEEDRYLDNCAKAWTVCYDSCPHFDERNISTIFYAKDDTAYSMMYGKDTVTIVSNFLGTDCTYIVSTELNETLSEHFPYYYNDEYKLYIHGIGTENFETGWLRDGWDYVTDTYILMAEMDCETMSIDTVKNYKKEHYKD